MKTAARIFAVFFWPLFYVFILLLAQPELPLIEWLGRLNYLIIALPGVVAIATSPLLGRVGAVFLSMLYIILTLTGSVLGIMIATQNFL